MPKGKWNEQDETTLMELHAHHHYKEIAETLGRTSVAIEARVKVLRRRGLLAPAPNIRGNHSRDWPDQDTSTLIELWNGNHHSGSEIANLLGISRSAVLGKLNRLREHGKIPREARLAQTKQKSDPAPRKRKNGNENSVLAVTPPPPKVCELRPPVTDGGYRFLELEDHQCKFALGEPMDRVTTETLFCGAIAVDGRPYCPDHCLICYHHTTRERAA